MFGLVLAAQVMTFTFREGGFDVDYGTWQIQTDEELREELIAYCEYWEVQPGEVLVIDGSVCDVLLPEQPVVNR